MIKSMTGFGKASAEVNGKTIVAELRSLNSKSLDLNLRLSSRYRDKESKLRGDLARQIERGKVDVSIYIENNGGNKPITINKDLAIAYYKELQELGTEIGQQPDNWINLLTRMPDVLGTEAKVDVTDEELTVLNDIISKAVSAFNSFRITEGLQLEKDMKLRLKNILDLLDQIVVLAPARAELVKTRLSEKLKEAANGIIDNNRLEQELIYYLEKLDITEEQVRLRSHCDYFISTMNENMNNGRKLGFITQEIGREINTIGSKANDADIQKYVVQMKDELEKMKEQLLNVL